MDTIELKVDELNCAACSSAVEKALNSVDGVVSSSVSVATGRATITGNNLNGELLVKIATDAGYPSEVIDEGIDPAKLATEIETRQNKNASDWKRRAILGVSIWAPFEALHWSAGFLGIEGPWVPWVMFLASTTSMILVGGGFFSSAIGAAKRFKTNMDTLITIGASSAYFFSLFIFISEKIFGYDLGYLMYFMEAAALLAIISIGHWLEATSTAKAGSASFSRAHITVDLLSSIDNKPILIASLTPGVSCLV